MLKLWQRQDRGEPLHATEADHGGWHFGDPAQITTQAFSNPAYNPAGTTCGTIGSLPGGGALRASGRWRRPGKFPAPTAPLRMRGLTRHEAGARERAGVAAVVKCPQKARSCKRLQLGFLDSADERVYGPYWNEKLQHFAEPG